MWAADSVECSYEIHDYEFQVRPGSTVVSFFFRNIDLQVEMCRELRFMIWISEESFFFFLEIWCPDAYKKFPSSDPTFDIFYISVPVVLLMKLYFKLPQTSLNKI